jgi:hypothetical protein
MLAWAEFTNTIGDLNEGVVDGNNLDILVGVLENGLEDETVHKESQKTSDQNPRRN